MDNWLEAALQEERDEIGESAAAGREETDEEKKERDELDDLRNDNN